MKSKDVEDQVLRRLDDRDKTKKTVRMQGRPNKKNTKEANKFHELQAEEEEEAEVTDDIEYDSRSAIVQKAIKASKSGPEKMRSQEK